MNIWSHMEGYDRELDENEFDQRLWDYMRSEEFEFNEQFDDYLNAYGIRDSHEFLRIIRTKKQLGLIRQ